MQCTLAAFINEGFFARHLHRMRRTYSERRECLLDATDKHLRGRVDVTGASAGLHVMLSVNNWAAKDDSKFVKSAADRRIAVTSTENFFAERPTALPLLFGFGGIDAGSIYQGVNELAGLIRLR